jgi:hypothetical protein
MGDSLMVGSGNEDLGCVRAAYCALRYAGWRTARVHIACEVGCFTYCEVNEKRETAWLTFDDAHAMRLAAGRMDFCGT